MGRAMPSSNKVKPTDFTQCCLVFHITELSSFCAKFDVTCKKNCVYNNSVIEFYISRLSAGLKVTEFLFFKKI